MTGTSFQLKWAVVNIKFECQTTCVSKYYFMKKKNLNINNKVWKNNIAQHFHGRKCEEIICKTHVNIEQYLNHYEKKNKSTC